MIAERWLVMIILLYDGNELLRYADSPDLLSPIMIAKSWLRALAHSLSTSHVKFRSSSRNESPLLHDSMAKKALVMSGKLPHDSEKVI